MGYSRFIYMVNHVTTLIFLAIDKPEDVSIKPDGILENNKKVKIMKKFLVSILKKP